MKETPPEEIHTDTAIYDEEFEKNASSNNIIKNYEFLYISTYCSFVHIHGCNYRCNFDTMIFMLDTSTHNSDVQNKLFIDDKYVFTTNMICCGVFSRVIIMDCIYKTNRYCPPSLEVVGVTSNDLTFSIAFAYLEKEREENYIWALERFKSLKDDIIMPSVIVTVKELAHEGH
ncbi:uncharacterized protein LOC111398001 [Olea europaea var. sylvestris]|uniref:uncharacterized protein LOC111398001 n=1 Tax=Olea europaea var. sylvestris TaxID=158386 RepID=UPI000C1D0B7B|nr:uncharacterized protein LOC111398001 [Olea europaea var. sylvestris]